MQVSDKNNRLLHNKLPIDEDEKILGIYKHHWFAYVSSWLLAAVIVIIIMGLAVVFTVIGGSEGALAQHKSQIISGAAVFCVVVLLATLVPVYLRSQEQMVLTEEALLQVLQPSLFSSKIDQLNLQRMDDVSVRQDFLGTVLGYGRITIETPGEQDNYEFVMLPRPQEIAREITRAHENYVAALQSGRLSSSLGSSPQQAVPSQIDPAQYEQLLQYQRMVKAQQAAITPNQPSFNPAPASAPEPADPITPTNES
jgi:uncharacterized membrane protein YdbT with pleckstrin-like domain